MGRWKYRTSSLYVTSYREGALRLSGCITLALMGLLAGGLFVLYEVRHSNQSTVCKKTGCTSCTAPSA